jgi:SNF2 family DNA or RNA helicase
MAAANSNYLDHYIQDYTFDEKEEKSYYQQHLYNNYSSYLPSQPAPPKANIEDLKKVWNAYKRIEQPDHLNITLFPHQLVSVYNMEQFERVRKVKYENNFFMTDFGILGDVPGYGKSFSIVSLILRDKMPWNVSQPHENTEIHTFNPCLKLCTRTEKKRVRTNLLLTSPTLIEQWKEYFSFVSDGKLKITDISTRKDYDKFDPNDWDVVIVSSARFNDVMDMTGRVVWKRFIFDEAASTHISGMRAISAGFTWFVSATYRELAFHKGTSSHYMRSFFSRIDTNMLKYFLVKNPTEFVQHSFKMPEVKEIRHVCLNPQILNVLSNYIDNETKVMIGAGDIKGAIARIGGGTTNESNLFDIVSRKQKEKLLSAKFSLEMWTARPNSAKEIEMWTKRIKEIETTLSELEQKYKKVLEDDCSICYSTISDPVLLPCCQNIFCGKCIITWFESTKSCPMCRSSINIKEIVYIRTGDAANKEEEKKDDSFNTRPKQKQEKVLDILKSGLPSGKKFLIFSMYDESFYIIRRILDEHRIDFVEICGSKASRDIKLAKIKQGKVNVVFLNSRFNGAGINLEMATDIILYHEMPLAIREQVIGRALRIGRKDDLTVHNLVF